MSGIDRRDEHFMRLALKEAKKGLGRTSPNPCVGAVLVKNGEVVSRGYHEKAGTPHAEVHALRRAGDEAAGADLYVTLEPCNHTGRTPPCSRAVADGGIRRVVIGMLDPNPLVDGGGAEYLRRAGIEVVHGVLAQQCREINRGFLKHIATGLPFVVLKAGLSLDGKITYRRNCGGAVTGAESWLQVHRLRNTLDAILVGIGTVAVDNPSLTSRLPGNMGRDPVRIILDTHLRILPEATVLNQVSDAPTWIVHGPRVDPEKAELLVGRGARLFPVAACGSGGGLDLHEVMRLLGDNGMTSVLVEGGAAVHGSFLRERLADRAHLFFAPIFAGDGGIAVVHGYEAADKAHAVRLSAVRVRRCGEDVSVSGDIEYPPALV